VTAQVASGLTRAEIATATGVSDSTVKSQLTTIYDKTNTKGQRELELLIRELTPPVKPEIQ
jgi:DNA-binding CsgD family transcriptional regulator